MLKLKIIDPAAGCGQFILGTIEFVRNKFKRKLSKTKLNQLLKIFAENCLFVVDLDENAVDLCKIAIWLETGSLISNHYVCANSLIQPGFKGNTQFLKKGNYINWADKFPEVFTKKNRGFDIVLGNPPYVSFSGRQAVKLDEQTVKHFKENFKIKGWLTTHSLFTELAIKYLSKRFTSFVVPSQVSHLAGYKDLRELLEQNTEINDIKHWGENVFPDACTPAMTFITENKKRTENSQEKHVLWFANTKNSLLEKISQNCFYLDKLVADPGVHTGNCSKKLIKTNQSECDNCFPVLEGKQVSRYTVSYTHLRAHET